MEKEKDIIRKENPTQERIVYLDVLRIFAIFAMMVLHISGSRWDASPVDGLDWQVFNIYDSLVRFCVPVFVMISGVFFLDHTREIKIKRLFSHNILRIITAFLFWSVAYAGFNVLLDMVIGGAALDKVLLKSFGQEVLQGHYHMWFLFTITGLYLITPILRKIASDKKTTAYFLILSLIACYTVNLLALIPGIGNTLVAIRAKTNLDLVLGYSGYFMLGHYLHQYDLDGKRKKWIYALAALSLILTIVLTGVWSLRAGKPTQALYDYLLPTTCLIAVAVFILFKDRLSKAQLTERTVRRIRSVSKLSFGMYLVHDFFIMILAKIGLTTVSFHPILSVPVIAITVFVLSLIAALVISKIPILKKYII